MSAFGAREVKGSGDFAKECLISLHPRPDCLPEYSDQSLLAIDRFLLPQLPSTKFRRPREGFCANPGCQEQ